MAFTNFTFDVDADGIALVTWNMPGRSMNVIDAKVMEELEAIVEKVASDAAIKGAVVTSGKDTFCGGADLTMLENQNRTFAELMKTQGQEAANTRLFDEVRKLSLTFRRIETCGKPWVAALNGTAMGGGFELALACHHRIASDNDKTRLGLPEIKVGLFPGGGGTQRVARMLPPADALQFLLKGDQLRVNRAKAMKLIDAVVPPARSGDGGQGLDQGRRQAPRRRGMLTASSCRAGPSIRSRADVLRRPPTRSTAARPTTTIRPRARSCRWSMRACSCRWIRRCGWSRATSRRSCARRKRRR